MLDLDFDRQRPIDEYIVDFYCKDLMLAIEIDGKSHEDALEKDNVRQRRLETLGVRFLRFGDIEIKTEMRNVIWTIEDWVLRHKDPSVSSALHNTSTT